MIELFKKKTYSYYRYIKYSKKLSKYPQEGRSITTDATNIDPSLTILYYLNRIYIYKKQTKI